MKRKFMPFLGLSLLLVMMFSLNSFASSGERTVTVGTGSVYTTGVVGVSRSGNYAYVDVNIISVYPLDNREDNFTKCRVRIYKNDKTGAAFSNEYTLSETDGNKSINLYNGGLSCLSFNIKLAGNNPEYGAGIRFKYDGK